MTLARQQALFATGATAERAMQDAASELALARATRAQAEQDLRRADLNLRIATEHLEELTIRAPITQRGDGSFCACRQQRSGPRRYNSRKRQPSGPHRYHLNVSGGRGCGDQHFASAGRSARRGGIGRDAGSTFRVPHCWPVTGGSSGDRNTLPAAGSRRSTQGRSPEHGSPHSHSSCPL